MQSLKIATVLMLALALRAQAQDPLTNGLVAYYPLNGNANDASGNGNNGVIHGTDWKFSFDRFGDLNSLYLNTTSAMSQSLDGAYVAAPQPAGLDFNHDFTLSVWVNLQAGTPPTLPQNFIGNGPNGPDAATNANLRIVTDHAGFGGQDILEFVWNTSGQIEHIIIALPPVRGTWWQTTVVRSGSIVSLYKNGSLLINGTMTRTVNSPEIWLGRHGGTPYPLFGGIDDVRMYNRALTPSEVMQLYVTETKCIAHAATATATVVNGFLVGINLTDLGCGYTNAPLVEILGGGGSGATATATISNGNVTGFTITDAGIGYTSAPQVVIASPPFTPWLEIGVSKVKVTQHVVLGKNYVLESSTDLITWTQVGQQFTAQEEVITQEFDVASTGQFFRIREVP